MSEWKSRSDSSSVSMPIIDETGTSFDAFEWPDVPVDNEFYRHTLLSWARLRHRWALTRDHSMVLETEESMNDIRMIPDLRMSKTKINTEITPVLINTIATMGTTIALFVVCLIFSLMALIRAIQPIPTGTILPYSGNAAFLLKGNTQWLFCDGSAVSRTQFNALFEAIGTSYGAGNGIDTFNLPDLRHRFLWGSSTTEETILSSGGNQTHTLTLVELPVHTHNVGTLATHSDGVHSHNYSQISHNHGGNTGIGNHPTAMGTFSNSGSDSAVNTIGSQSHTIPSDTVNITIQSSGSHTHTITGATASEGQSQAFSVMPPYQTVHYIIRT